MEINPSEVTKILKEQIKNLGEKTEVSEIGKVLSVIKSGKTATELSSRHKIPLSSVYKKISDLEELSLIKVDKWQISDKGRKFKVYKSRIKQAEIIIKNPEPRLELFANKK